MSRQRERQSLLHYYSEECPACGGTGNVYTLDTVMMRIERGLRRISGMGREKEIQLRVAPEVAVFLFEHNGRRLADLEKALELELDIRDDPRLRREEVRIFLARNGKDVTKEFLG